MHKELYGLNQVALAWLERLEKCLSKIELKKPVADTNVYMGERGEDDFHLPVYVEDVFLIGTNERNMWLLAKDVATRFEVRVEQTVTNFDAFSKRSRRMKFSVTVRQL